MKLIHKIKDKDTFYTFEHKYLFVKQLRFKETTFLRVQTYHFRHRSSCPVSGFCIFSSFSFESRRQTKSLI